MPSVQLGTGLSTLAGTMAGKCIDVPADTSPDPTTAQRTFKLSYATDTSTLKTALSLDANVAWKAGLSAVEASANYFNSETIDSSSAYLVLDVSVQFPAKVLDPANLTAGAIGKLKADPEGFYVQCGDQFVSSITKGALFRAIYKFTELSEKSKVTLGATLKANSGNWSGSSTFKSSLEKASTQYHTELMVLQQGGTFGSVAMAPADLIAQAADFGSATSLTPITYQNAYPVSVTTRSYYTTNNFPSGQRFPDITAELNQLSNMAPYYESARLLQNDIRNRLARPGRLRDAGCEADLAALTNKQAEVDRFVLALKQKADACRIASQCGASAECTAPFTPIDFSLPLLTKQNCGPRCTDGVNSTYEFDRYGYCTRCRYQSFPNQTVQPGEGDALGVDAAECKYLRPGANALIRYQGNVMTNQSTGWGGTWIDVVLVSSSAPEANNCDNNAANCFYRSALGGYYQPTYWPFALSENITVGSAAPDSGVRASLTNAQCQFGTSNQYQCTFYGGSADICDVDGTDCGVP